MLPHTIQHSAIRFPDRDAYRCAKQSITYAELDKKTNQLAQLLISLGLKKGDRVGVYLNRSLDTPITIYGIMKAGAAFVPIDPGSPAARVRSLLENCEIEHLITHAPLRRMLNQVLSEPIDLKNIIGVNKEQVDTGSNAVNYMDWTSLDELDAIPPAVKIVEHDLAYIMFTSGSTGTPKGIMHTHHSGLNYAKLSAELYGLTEHDRVANHAPLHFDISTFGYFSAPLKGATTEIIPDAYTKMPASLTKLMEDEKITIWYSVPLALVQMIRRGVLEERNLESLRWVLYGGEVFPVKHLRTLMLQWPQARFSNVYGPAEVNQCTYYHIPKPPDEEDVIPLGQVWDNTEMLILGAGDQDTAKGEIGELLIRSGTRMRGYWKQEALTNKGFYKKMISVGNEAVYYRTGDLVRLREDGLLMFMGRKDRQVKTRGYRVELDEVEAVLINHPSVQEAAIIALQKEDNLKIIAMIILKQDHAASESDLKDHLAKQLPWYAVPQQFNFTDQFPRTSSGKIDRPALQKQLFEISER